MTEAPFLTPDTGMDVASNGRRERLVLGIAVLLTLIVATLEIRGIRDYFASAKEDWRGVAAYLEARLVDGDVILCDGVLTGEGGDAGRAQRALRYYLESRYPDELILRESEIPGKLGEIGDDRGEVWAVVFRGWRKLDSTGRQGVTVTDFEDISVIRATDPDATLSENAAFMLEALISLMPLEEATGALHTALAGVRGQSSRSHLDKGNALLEQGDVDAAISEYEQASEMDPNLAGAHVRLADARMTQERYRDAVDGYLRALELKPAWGEEPWMHMRLANAYRDNGQTEKAVEEYRKVLELEPGHSGALRGLEGLAAELAPSATNGSPGGWW